MKFPPQTGRENDVPATCCKQRSCGGRAWTDRRSIESLVGSAFDLLQYLAFPVSLTQLKCVALLALKRHPPFTNTVLCLISAGSVAFQGYISAD
jgi:hypothetical protein